MRSISAASIVLLLLCASAFAQETIALAIEGWSSQERSGIVTYRCASKICADGSLVSYRRQPHRPDLPFATFENYHRRLVEKENGGANPAIVSAVLRNFKEREIEGARVFSVDRDVVWKDGSTSAQAYGWIIGAGGTLSLFSNSARPEWTAANFNGFLPRIIDIAMITPPRE